MFQLRGSKLSSPMLSRAGALLMSRQPLPTGRKVPSLGVFTTSPFTTMQLEPPPSRLTAFTAPKPRNTPPASASDTPDEAVLRPSMTTRYTRVLSALKPMHVRG